MKNLIVFLLIMNGVGLFACDDDCTSSSGEVLYQISCNSQNGLAFLIKVTGQNATDTIATTTLPGTYQSAGSKIFFRTRTPEHPLFCTTNIAPPKKEYDIYDVSSKPCSNE
jgi:hypothetical protein